MPIIDISINQYIDNKLITDNKEREAKHEPSGKLSASTLYQPLRFQVLKTLGAPRKEFDAYTLAKFKRGQDVEVWYVEQLKGSGVLVTNNEILESYGLTVTDGQPQANYRDAIGYIDSVIDTNKMQAKKGLIPNEIKSVTNMKLKRIDKTGIDWHYQIQACFYALAMGVDYYAVTIISAEDLRSQTHIFPVSNMKTDVEIAIEDYQKAMNDWETRRILPEFEANPNVAWTKNLKYAMFEPEWVENGDAWAIKELEKLGK